VSKVKGEASDLGHKRALIDKANADKLADRMSRLEVRMAVDAVKKVPSQ
jgi:hypothetical protein